jgi:hypothetical protein
MKGDIILMYNKDRSFFPRAIEFIMRPFAKKHGVKVFTHSCFSLGEFPDGVEIVLSAEWSMTPMPLDKFRTDQFYFEVYAVNDKFLPGITESDLDKLLYEIYYESAGKPYAFFQNIWFIYRALLELLGVNMIGKKNWFPDNENCSESTAAYLIKRFERLAEPNKALDFLHRYNTNAIHPVDLAVMVKENPDIFVLREAHGTY